MPTKSTGCYTCRKRKIRCDETRPGCNRCRVHNVPCPGYRLPPKGQVIFQNDTQETVVNAHKTYKTKAPTVYTRPISPATTSSDSTLGATDSLFEDVDIERRDSPLDFALITLPSPTHLPSPSLEKTLIYSTFLSTYLPKFPTPTGTADTNTNFSFLSTLISTPNLRSEVADALDALSLAQVGSTFGDKTLLREAVRSYSRSLGGLVRTMAKGEGSGVRDDYVLATVTLLANCEFYDEISQMGDGWVRHIQGQQQLLAARGPASITSRLSLLIYSNMRHAALSHALIGRKASFMGTPEWRAVAWRAPHVDAATVLYDSALQVPGILERADNLDSESPAFLSELDGILEDARRLRGEMRSWYDSYDSQSKLRNPHDDSLFWLTKISNFQTFTGLCSDRTLDEAYMFSSFMVGYLLSVYWDTVHFLQTTVQKLHIRRHAASREWTPDEDEAVTEDELMSYVMDLCKCFPYFCEPVSSSTGKIALFLPLRTASLYFMEKGHWQMLKWVASVRDSVFNGGMQPPRMSPNAAVIATLGRPG